jgi:hypothetical protein
VIAIVDYLISSGLVPQKRVTQLLGRPRRRRLRGDGHVSDASSIVGEEHQDEQETVGRSRDPEEIGGDDGRCDFAEPLTMTSAPPQAVQRHESHTQRGRSHRGEELGEGESALGQRLSGVIGFALAARYARDDRRVFVFLRRLRDGGRPDVRSRDVRRPSSDGDASPSSWT